ncbi:hypothetical protein HGRIS_002587 [Hohenbuehelia grisea]|uniref:Uncharacterized protein n=1 Tax=Hohenbuehelia grisea TaxID=104357 RepID=A0ABR3JLG1_9AGAR
MLKLPDNKPVFVWTHPSGTSIRSPSGATTIDSISISPKCQKNELTDNRPPQGDVFTKVHTP